MFDKLFKSADVVARHQAAPLLNERLRFLEHLEHARLAASTLRMAAQYLLVVNDYLQLANRHGEVIQAAEIEEAAIRWSKRRRTRNCHSRHRFVGHATRWLQFLGRWTPAPPTHAFVAQVSAYSESMRAERCLAPATILYRCWTVEDFVPRLNVPLSAVTISKIDTCLMAKITDCSYARRSVRTYVGVLRDFFRFAEAQGWCRRGLATGIRAPRVFPQEPLPSEPSWESVQALIAGCHSEKPVDLRNQALLMLLAVYGFRAGEVVRLMLDDFDWREERLLVRRSKSDQPQTYPLCQSVGNAVLRYLRAARPSTDCRAVFLTMRPPFRPLSRVALTAMVTRKLKALGVPLSHYGPHALRHACATHLLIEGLSLKEIGDHLGHRHAETTTIYAKVDLPRLREVADFDLGGVL